MNPHKTITRTASLFALLFALAVELGATPIAIAKKEKDLGDPYNKVYEQEFSANSNSVLDLNTSFADVTINSWNQNKVAVNVECTVESKNEKRANELLEDIKVKLKQNGNTIIVEAEFNGSCGKDNESFEIEISINAPAGLTSELAHSFGDLTINNMEGEMYVNSSYGSVELKNCTSDKNRVHVSFGDLSIDQFHGEHLTIEYGDATVENLSANCNLNNSFGALTVERVTGESDLNVNNSYGETRIIVNDHFGFTSTSSYGSVNIKGNVSISKEDKDWFTESISGGDKSAPIQITVNNSFGEVDLISKN